MGNNTETNSLPTMGDDPTGDYFDSFNRDTPITPKEPTPDNPEIDRVNRANERIEQELGDLYMRSEEADIERSFLGAELGDSIEHLRQAEERLNTVLNNPNVSERTINAARQSVTEAEAEYGRVNQLYRDAQKRVDDMNRRITELETGFSF